MIQHKVLRVCSDFLPVTSVLMLTHASRHVQGSCPLRRFRLTKEHADLQVLEPDHLCSMDVHKGLMVASYVLKSQDLVPRTSRQKAILRPLPAGCQLCVIINLPSLTRRSILTNPFEPELVMRPQWEGFTAAGQPVLVFVSGRSCGMSVVVYDTDTGIPLAVHKVEDGSIATLHDQRVAASPTQSLLALAFRTRDAAAANYWSTSGFHAVVLDLGSGKVHTVVDGFDSQKHSLWAEWDWAPSGLAAAFWRRDNYDADLCIWHVASQAVIFSTSCKTIRHAWSPDGRFCALLRDDELEHMLNLSIPNAKACPAEVYMEEQPAPDLPYKPHRSRTSSSFTFSPCSSYFLRVGGNCPSPTDVDQWRLLPGKAALEYQVVSQRIKPESRRPVVTWYQCAPLAGVYALLQHRSHLQIMSSAQARQLASWQVSEEDPQGFKHPVDAMSWSPDGRNLACQGQKGFTLFNFQALGE